MTVLKKTFNFFTRKDVKIIAKDTLYEGFFSLNLYRFKYRLFNGEMSGEIKREIFRHSNVAILLPFDPVRDEIVLVEQIRIASYDISVTPWLIEMVAGTIEKNETPEQAVRREAMEETGLVIGRIQPIISYLANPGSTSERSYILIGEVDTSTKNSVNDLINEDENIRTHTISLEQAYQWMKSGKIDNAASIIALQWLQLHYQELKYQWKIKLSTMCNL